jgi:peptide/nickel transport system permease protein
MGLVRHLARRGVLLIVTLILAIYFTVLVANGGGYIDRILASQIQYDLRQQLANDQAYRHMTPANQTKYFNDQLTERLRARGLDTPFLERTFIYTIDALTLSLGKSQTLTSTDGSHSVYAIIAERLPRTLVLFTVATAVGAVFGIWLGLWMARKALTVFDRGATVVSVTTNVVPPWVFGIFFLLSFAYSLKLFPPGGWIGNTAPAQGTAGWYLDVGWHMLLPMIAFIVATFGSWSYTTRNLVLQIMDEDFVNAARARGLPEKTVLRKYVFRAASPAIVTSLALALITAWQGAIITETIFNYEGIGQLFYEAIVVFDAPVVIGLTAIYAFLLVATVFLLEVIYTYLDPRVRALHR